MIKNNYFRCKIAGIAQRVNLTSLDVHDVSGNGIEIGASRGNDSWPFQCVDNTVRKQTSFLR
eukprot:COSAG06_NODE_25125_length_644_cov_1.715596_1_plen_61_part_10